MISNDEMHAFWQCARRINPTITLDQARRLVLRLLRQKRETERRGPTQ